MKTYNAHRSYNAWNVALWIANEYIIYKNVEDAIKENIATKTVVPDNVDESVLWTKEELIKSVVEDVANDFLNNNKRTPDGAKYNRLNVSLAIEDMVEYEVEEYIKAN